MLLLKELCNEEIIDVEEVKNLLMPFLAYLQPHHM